MTNQTEITVLELEAVSLFQDAVVAPSNNSPITMAEALICDTQRTAFGKYAGALSSIRADDLAAIPIKALMARNSGVDWEQVDDVILGCANQAGEDNRNIARMSLLLAGLPIGVSGMTINRLCRIWNGCRRHLPHEPLNQARLIS